MKSKEPTGNKNNVDTQSTSKPGLDIVVEFTGGLEILFNDQKVHHLSFPAHNDNDNNSKITYTDLKHSETIGNGTESQKTVAWLIEYLCQHLMTDSRKDMFVLDDHVRPGILVLINDADWELCGEERYILQPNDNILFVSTLHGG